MKTYLDHRLRRFHRLQLCALYAGEVQGYPACQPGQADLRRQPGEPEGHRGRRPPCVRAGRHLRQGTGRRACSHKYDFDYVINFAAESHVDRTIKNPEIFVREQRDGHRQPAAVRQGRLVSMPTPRPGKRARSTCRSPPTRCTAHWVPTATSWRPPRCAPTAPILPPRPAPICSSWHSMTPTACR